MFELIIWLAIITLGLLLLFLSLRVGFKHFKESIEGHERKIDFHRRENILSHSRHENRIDALEQKISFLHEALEKIKSRQDKKKAKGLCKQSLGKTAFGKRKIQATV